MYDADKIIIGLLIFLCFITLPIWYAVTSTGASNTPEPIIISSEEPCVESAQYMKENHMQLLDNWKNSVVRDGIRTYVATDGKEYTISLSNTCLECHSNKAEFCDQCHDYVGVKPFCWDCHNIPEEGIQ